MNQFMVPMGLSAYRLALFLRITSQRVYEIIHGERRITAQTALRLAKCFDTSAQFWLNMQTDYELAQTRAQWEERIEAEVITLRMGEQLIANFQEIVRQATKLHVSGCNKTEAADAKAESEEELKEIQKILDSLSDRDRKVYAIISNADKSIYFDLIIEELYRAQENSSVGSLSSALTMLESRNLIERMPGDAYKKATRKRLAP